tara:strand:+ start:2176 stop:3291 length:1116 start_codon:yes stop_codon:yes gene_type:complete
MKQKIIIVVNDIKNIYLFRLSLIRELINLNFNVEIICNKSSFKDRYKKNLKKIKIYKLDSGKKNISFFDNLFYFFSLYKIINKSKPIIVLSYTIKPNIYSSLVCKLLKINCICTLTGLGSTFINGGLLKQITFLLYKFSKSKNTNYIFQNIDDKNIFKEQSIITNNNFKIIPGSGIDVKQYGNIKSKINLHFTFLVIARLITHKGIFEYYEAAKKLKKTHKNFKFILIGDYNSKDKYSISDDLYNKIRKKDILNYQNYSDNVSNIISNSDCVILPSYREGMSKSLLEAAYLKKPLLATNVPGCKEIVINNKNGFLFKRGNINDLASKMIKISRMNNRKLKSFGIFSYNHVKQNFTSDIINKLYIDLINSKL